MSVLVIPLYKLFDKLNILISGYIFFDLLSFKDASFYSSNDTIIKKIAVLLPILWYLYLITNKLINRKLVKKQQDLETKNLELSNEIKKSILKRVKSGNIEDIMEEIEQLEKNKINNINEKN